MISKVFLRICFGFGQFLFIHFFCSTLLLPAPLCSGEKGGAPTLLLPDFPSSLNLSLSLLEVEYVVWNMLLNTNCLSKVIFFVLAWTIVNTLTSKIDSRISMVSCMNNYVGTINNNCVGSMALVTWLPSFLLKNDLGQPPSSLIYCQQQETAQ